MSAITGSIGSAGPGTMTGPHTAGHGHGHGHGECYRRRDGALLSAADLAQSQPLHTGELQELAHLVTLLEDWLLHTGDDVRDDLADFNHPHGIAAIIEDLGTWSVKLHRLTRHAH